MAETFDRDMIAKDEYPPTFGGAVCFFLGAYLFLPARQIGQAV